MEELGTERVLMDECMGHLDGSVSARYAHVTPAMRKRLTEALTERWEASLDARLAMCPRSPVAALDELLRARAKKKLGDDPKIISQISPKEGVSLLVARPRKRA